jgi:hypothetical protein
MRDWPYLAIRTIRQGSRGFARTGLKRGSRRVRKQSLAPWRIDPSHKIDTRPAATSLGNLIDTPAESATGLVLPEEFPRNEEQLVAATVRFLA